MKPFRLLTLAVAAAAIVPRLAHRGMFVDGVTYAAIARNLAEGRGSFWSPRYTATLYPEFHDHPPLGFWLQSLWFRALGDHLFVERVYALAAALITAWLIVVMWRSVEGPADAGTQASVGSGFSRTIDSWPPVAFWIAVPGVSWAIVGNLLETSMAVFTLAAVIAALRSARADSRGRSLAWAACSGLCVTAAVLTKGPVGLFPLAAPLAFFRLSGVRRPWSALAGQWLAVAACALLLAVIPDARVSLARYIDQQVVAAISGQREMSAGSLTILGELVQGVALPMAVVALVSIALAGRFVRPSTGQRDSALAFLVVGLAGSLPILVSAKQAGHYLIPAVPFFALAAASMLVPTIEALEKRLTPGGARAVTLASLVVATGTAVAAFSPAVGRDRARMADLEAMATVVPRGAVVGLCPDANGDWGLHAWFERRYHVSLDAANWRGREWLLKTGGPQAGCPPVTCTPASDSRRNLVLMTCVRPR